MSGEYVINETTTTTPPAIYAAMVQVMLELSKVGIAKDRRNEAQNFRFRGIDEVMNVVCPILAKHNVLMLPNYRDITPSERVTGKDRTLYVTRLTGTYTFISALDGTFVSVTAYGEAMDSGDKSCSKAKAMALKYALLQTFLIPTEGDNDPDATTQEPSVPKPPQGFEEWFAAVCVVGDKKGLDTTREAWNASSEEFRNYAFTYRRADWDAAKARAAAFDASVAAPPVAAPPAPAPDPTGEVPPQKPVVRRKAAGA